jgi:hypothetical protein
MNPSNSAWRPPASEGFSRVAQGVVSRDADIYPDDGQFGVFGEVVRGNSAAPI